MDMKELGKRRDDGAGGGAGVTFSSLVKALEMTENVATALSDALDARRGALKKLGLTDDSAKLLAGNVSLSNLSDFLPDGYDVKFAESGGDYTKAFGSGDVTDAAVKAIRDEIKTKIVEDGEVGVKDDNCAVVIGDVSQRLATGKDVVDGRWGALHKSVNYTLNELDGQTKSAFAQTFNEYYKGIGSASLDNVDSRRAAEDWLGTLSGSELGKTYSGTGLPALGQYVKGVIDKLSFMTGIDGGLDGLAKALQGSDDTTGIKSGIEKMQTNKCDSAEAFWNKVPLTGGKSLSLTEKQMNELWENRKNWESQLKDLKGDDALDEESYNMLALIMVLVSTTSDEGKGVKVRKDAFLACNTVRGQRAFKQAWAESKKTTLEDKGWDAKGLLNDVNLNNVAKSADGAKALKQKLKQNRDALRRDQMNAWCKTGNNEKSTLDFCGCSDKDYWKVINTFLVKNQKDGKNSDGKYSTYHPGNGGAKAGVDAYNGWIGQINSCKDVLQNLAKDMANGADVSWQNITEMKQWVNEMQDTGLKESLQTAWPWLKSN